MTKQEKIADVLTRGVEEVIDRAHLEKRLKGKEKLRIKLGIDPTSPNIHIGRAVTLWKLRAFQDLGHQVVFIVGDFTGLIGDTSDKEAERPMLTEATVKQNLKTYFDQAFKILDKQKTELHYNSKWLKKLGFLEIGKLADAFGLHEFSARENIKKRLDAGKRVSLRELLYPLMQGYDSVAIKSDVELGGTDQKFNVLAGRTIQRFYNQEPQDVMTLSLLEGTDGRKMSSSWGNVINLLDTPADMVGKVMRVEDRLLEKYFILATRIPLGDVKKIMKSSKNPRDIKLQLALEITTLYHGKAKATAAVKGFIAQFSNNELPTDIELRKMEPGMYALSELLALHGLASSKSEARRLIDQKGVKVNQKTVSDETVVVDGKVKHLLQVGKRKFLYIQ